MSYIYILSFFIHNANFCKQMRKRKREKNKRKEKTKSNISEKCVLI